MAVEIREENAGKTLYVHAKDHLTADDYHMFVPVIERLIARHGKVDILFDMRDFAGWSGKALWEDVKFDVKHFRDIAHLAIVGDKRWEAMMAKICRPFTTAEIRYFDAADYDRASEWIRFKQAA